MSNKTVSKEMIMKQPATRWQDALPCGNGILGALVYGHIRDEKIVFNHDNLWLRQDKPELRPVNQYLDELREMLLQGKYRKGWDFFEDKLKENYSGVQRPAPNQPAFDILLKMETESLSKRSMKLGSFPISFSTKGL